MTDNEQFAYFIFYPGLIIFFMVMMWIAKQ